MNQELSLNLLFTLGLSLLSVIVGAVVLYFVIRLAITHGMNSHVRWIDDGKD